MDGLSSLDRLEAILSSLQGAKLGEACEFMMDAGVKILVFEDNQKAEEFARAVNLKRRTNE